MMQATIQYRLSRLAWIISALVTGGLCAVAPVSAQVPADGFDLKLQTTGDWSGQYTGAHLGLNPHTVILYENSIFPPGTGKPRWPEALEDLDYELYYDHLRSAVQRMVPGEFDGVVIIDIERYPITLYSPWHEEYRRPRIALEKRLDPTISDEEALRRAAEKHEVLARKLFLDGVRIAKGLRPEAQWGVYGMITGDRNRPTDDKYRWINDQSQWLWHEVDVLTRPIYVNWLESEENWPRERDLQQDKIQETCRLASDAEKATGKRPKVYSYVNFRVLGCKSAHIGSWLTQQQSADILNNSWQGGADGALLWEAVRDQHPTHPTEEAYTSKLDSQVHDALASVGLGAFAASRDRTGDDEQTVASQPPRLRIRVRDGARLYLGGTRTYQELRNVVTDQLSASLQGRSQRVKARVHSAARSKGRIIKDRVRSKQKQEGDRNSGGGNQSPNQGQ